jgi:hypothetical protein
MSMRPGHLGFGDVEVFENVRRGGKTLPLPKSQIRFLPILMRFAPVQACGHPFGESPNEQPRNHFQNQPFGSDQNTS